ncbi:MAG TPA: aldehyde dehydrogenase (NADP(+)) [Vicinamibacterales bacterium]|nr:aldehyde dehydrogenase (NADP(+)) [Vicinamibacterales bacterium]
MPGTFHAVNPATGQPLPPEFRDATTGDVDAALSAAAAACAPYRALAPARIAGFLDKIATELEALGDALVERAHAETGLPLARLQNERERTINGVRIFADLIREGSWISARIDRGNPGRAPTPKPDLRTMLVPIGPVVVFGASNFPLAISVAGDDTIGALAAGCPVVVKAHPAHPGTSDLVAGAIEKAVIALEMPTGVFSLVHGAGHEVGLALVKHTETRAVAFTGSLAGGRALFDAASARLEPIPVYAEMGSINPVILLPGALAARASEIGTAYIKSVTMGVGQFCTNPGLVLGMADVDLDRFIESASLAAGKASPATMLHAGIRDAFLKGVARIEQTPGVTLEGKSRAEVHTARTEAPCVIFSTTAAVLASEPHLSEEVFGPTSAVVKCRDRAELERTIRQLTGHLTASVHGTPADLVEYRDLIALLETKVGRIIFNGFGTGLEVCAALHHGGPYPATTDAHFTSIGQGGIFRFARPLCYQNFPQEALPEALRDRNAMNIWRVVDGALTRDDVTPLGA